MKLTGYVKSKKTGRVFYILKHDKKKKTVALSAGLHASLEGGHVDFGIVDVADKDLKTKYVPATEAEWNSQKGSDPKNGFTSEDELKKLLDEEYEEYEEDEEGGDMISRLKTLSRMSIYSSFIKSKKDGRILQILKWTKDSFRVFAGLHAPDVS